MSSKSNKSKQTPKTNKNKIQDNVINEVLEMDIPVTEPVENVVESTEIEEENVVVENAGEEEIAEASADIVEENKVIENNEAEKEVEVPELQETIQEQQEEVTEPTVIVEEQVVVEGTPKEEVIKTKPVRRKTVQEAYGYMIGGWGIDE